MSFTAKFAGDCVRCDDPVLPGQEAEYNWDREVQHVVCPESIGRGGKPAPLCPRCFLELSVTGTCGNCDD